MIQIKQAADGTFAGVRTEAWGKDFDMVWIATGVDYDDVRNAFLVGFNKGAKSLSAMRKVREMLEDLPRDRTYVTVINNTTPLKLNNWEQTSHDTFILRRLD